MFGIQISAAQEFVLHFLSWFYIFGGFRNMSYDNVICNKLLNVVSLGKKIERENGKEKGQKKWSEKTLHKDSRGWSSSRFGIEDISAHMFTNNVSVSPRCYLHGIYCHRDGASRPLRPWPLWPLMTGESISSVSTWRLGPSTSLMVNVQCFSLNNRLLTEPWGGMSPGTPLVPISFIFMQFSG